ncbi:MAG TPA: non-heme iron oxygenase ferredoxin subunit [Herbaspirillum sp.]|uniref:non-heme iron oxygenase ferredoxin subunit n=1 Tax=Herbaspirillum sp. TaxID=1890675 RepID=UPI002D33B0FC|nr:non-heme iron oxygenase ferredoxin subunit [Herbaspirillum sp.]HZG18571.1 non-heme iron oxygenase ferredoxin subunit [Herbaspirillum sp.]
MNQILPIVAADRQVDAPQPDAQGWMTLGPLAEVFGSRACRSLRLDGAQVGLFLVDGAVYAIDDICSHGNARLSEGELDGFEVECPLHAGLFDIRSGKALSAPLTRDVRSHEVSLEDGVLRLRLVAA